MAPHSSTLAWKIPWMEEPGRLQSMGSLWVRHDWASSVSLFTFMHWRRRWQPTPLFLPGESQGRGSLVSCRLWGCTESDTTEMTQQQQQQQQQQTCSRERELTATSAASISVKFNGERERKWEKDWERVKEGGREREIKTIIRKNKSLLLVRVLVSSHRNWDWALVDLTSHQEGRRTKHGGFLTRMSAANHARWLFCCRSHCC